MTDERALKLARKVCAEQSHIPGAAGLILEGAWDRTPEIQCTLAAIKLTTQLAADLADGHCARIPSYTPDEPMKDRMSQGYGNAALNIEMALRRFDHLPVDGGEK